MGDILDPVMMGAFIVGGLGLGEGGRWERCYLDLGGLLGFLRGSNGPTPSCWVGLGLDGTTDEAASK